jgi:glycosyltransferase involved in cell wall biosynthesis
MSNSISQVLIIGKVWPEPDSSAAGSRMMQLIHVFLEQQWKVTFASAATKSGYEIDLKDLGIEEKSIRLNHSSFDDLVKELQPDIVIYDRFTSEEQFGWRVRAHCSDALQILDTEDLHSLRQARYLAWKTGAPTEIQELDIAKREIASIYRCDLSLIISPYEMELLKTTFNVDESLLVYLPFMLNKIQEKMVNDWQPYHKRDHFVSIGNFLHEPNWSAVLYLKEKVWPLIKARLPKTELHIYGAYSSQKVEQLHNEDEGFHIKGRAKNAGKVVGASKVLLSPLQFGAGLKGKFIEAMQVGTPSVTTQIGAEGMHTDFPWPGAIEEHPKDFADAAIELYGNEEKWKAAQLAGIPIINRLYNKEKLSTSLIQRIVELRSNLSCKRKQNFIGQMLQYHTAASTKYMGKWIEEKNK